MKTYGEVDELLHHSSPQHSLEKSGQFHAPAVLPLGKQPPVPIG
jgi:hypothetical protein